MTNKKRNVLLAGAGLVILSITTLGVAVAHNGMWSDVRGGHAASFNVTGTSAAGRFVTLTTDTASATLSNIDLINVNSTHPLITSAQLTLPVGATSNSSAGQRGMFVVQDNVGDILAARDSPEAELAASSVNGTTVTVAFPAGASIVTHDAVSQWSPAGATVTYASGQVANLRLSKNATVSQSGQVLTVTLGAQGTMDYGILTPHGDGGFCEGRGFGGFGHGSEGGSGHERDGFRHDGSGGHGRR